MARVKRLGNIILYAQQRREWLTICQSSFAVLAMCHFLFLVLQHHKPKSVIRISLCRTTQRNPNDRFGLKRYDGKQEKLLQTKQVYQYNEGIRAVLRECDINRMVTILDTVTGKEVQKPICDVATSHMARRNFIGNLYKKVKDPELVSSMTGHVNGSRAFARYREIDEETKVNLVNLINQRLYNLPVIHHYI